VTRAAVIDYGAGNLVSITMALEAVGATVDVVAEPDGLRGAGLIVVPGVGASGPAMTRLRRRGLDRGIRAAIDDGAWYLGICLGLQLLFEHSDEDGAEMLGLLRGTVRRVPDAPRLPHIGWNQLALRGDHPLMRGVADGAPAYFVHSFAGEPADASVVVAETEHGGRFVSAIGAGRLLGTQFHAERSGADGLRILRNAVELAAGGEGRHGSEPAPLAAAG
jgi:imidazole glycerol-phosphate synthase subunit HisH